MAEIITSSSRKGKRSRKKLSTRVDLTPMVDLGFLLITFFIFTTSMSEPKSMKLRLPADTPTDPSVTIESKTLNILPAGYDKVYYYSGNDLAHMQVTGYGNNGIRTIIDNARKRVASRFGNAKELVILIKPLTASTYNNVATLLDEMLINDVSRYMITDPSGAELASIK